MTADPTDVSASHPGGYQFYVTIDGARQGTFKGTAKGTSGRFTAIRFSYEVQIPPRLPIGEGGGHPKHNPISITKEWDAASPQLFQAAATNEPLKSVLFEFVNVTQDGKEETYYQIKLTNAAVFQYKQYTDRLPEGGANTFELEDVSFTFQKIDIAHPPGGTGATATTAGGRIAGTGAATAPERSPARLAMQAR